MTPDAVCERHFHVRSEFGLHARPAGQLVQTASAFQARLEVRRADGNEWVDGRSILSLLTLGAGPDTQLCVRAEGDDAEALLEAVGEILEAPTLPQEPAA